MTLPLLSVGILEAGDIRSRPAAEKRHFERYIHLSGNNSALVEHVATGYDPRRLRVPVGYFYPPTCVGNIGINIH